MTIEEAVNVLKCIVIDTEDLSAGVKRTQEKALDFTIKALEKQIPKKPTEYDSVPHARCPQCTRGVRVYCDSAKVPFCQWCGQALDWSDNDD